MATFLPGKNFTGYPDGKTPVRFLAGVESIEVTEEFAQLMRDKGLVATEAEAKFFRATRRRAKAIIKPPTAKISKKIAAATKTRRPGRRQVRSSPQD